MAREAPSRRNLLVAGLAGIAATATAQASLSQSQRRTVRGRLLYRERILLPETAVARIVVSAVRSRRVLAEQTIALAGRQPPIAFAIAVPGPDDAADGCTLTGAFLVGDAAEWISEPVGFRFTADDVSLGDIALRRGARRPPVLGGEWRVEDIDGAGIIDNARVTLSFGEDGRLSGHASCNGYTAAYTLAGDRLKVDRAAATMRACAPAVMQQEGRFLAALGRVERAEVAADGALVLSGSGGERIVARRPR